MAKLTNETIEKLQAENKVSSMKESDSYAIFVSTSSRMLKYARDYRKKDKASHIAAGKVLLTA